jgi:hypothetical protein
MKHLALALHLEASMRDLFLHAPVRINRATFLRTNVARTILFVYRVDKWARLAA